MHLDIYKISHEKNNYNETDKSVTYEINTVFYAILFIYLCNKTGNIGLT
jgi:hypothetical protein